MGQGDQTRALFVQRGRISAFAGRYPVHVGQFYFSAYLKSDYIAELHNNERLGIAELQPTLQAVVEEARDKIKDQMQRDEAYRNKIRQLIAMCQNP